MRNPTLVLLLASLFSFASCSSDDDLAVVDSAPETSSNTNQEQIESEVAVTEPMLISTANLANSGIDNEVPVLVERSSFSFSKDARIALSPDGKEFAIVSGDSDKGGRLAIYSTTTEMLLRDFSFPIADISHQIGVVLWGQDDVLTMLYNRVGGPQFSGSEFMGQVLNSRSGEVLADVKDPNTHTCPLRANKENNAFNPSTNKFYCVRQINDQANLEEIDTRTLTRKILYSLTAMSINNGAWLSHDGSEVAFTINDSVPASGPCCASNPTTLFVSTENFQPSRSNQMNRQITIVMGDGFDIIDDLEEDRFYLDDSDTIIEHRAIIIRTNFSRTMAAGIRPFFSGQPNNEGFRVFTLPEGIVVGDIITPTIVGIHSLMSVDGTVLALITEDSAKIYDTESRTNLTVFTRQ